MTRLFSVVWFWFVALQHRGMSFVQLYRFIGTPMPFHRRQGGTGRRRRRLLLTNGFSVDHWVLVTALTPFWRCGESDQRYLTALETASIGEPLKTPSCRHATITFGLFAPEGNER